MNSAKGVTRLIKATGYSLQGLKAAWTHEAAFRQECVVFLVATLLVPFIPVALIEKILLLVVLLLVMVTELINSAIEAVVDRIGVEHHELSGRAKDIGSAAVLLMLLLAVAVWAALLGPVLWHYLH